jgi:spore coat polysaccharide biosynthesis predicted glycosyltransferase SpsG
MDVRTPFDQAEIDAIREAGCRLAVLDDASERRRQADVSFFPPGGAVLDWAGAMGEHHIGFDWIPLRRQFSPPPMRRTGAQKLALILAGGSDPAGIGRRFLASAARAMPASWNIAMVIGAAAAEDPGVEGLARSLGPRLTLYRQLADVAGLMAQADLALASFGMTAYELAAVGVPMLLLCLSEDHRLSAVALAEKDAAEIVGIAGAVADEALDQAVARICADECAREKLGRKARRLVDGKGVSRIAERLVAAAKAKSATADARRRSATA